MEPITYTRKCPYCGATISWEPYCEDAPYDKSKDKYAGICVIDYWKENRPDIYNLLPEDEAERERVSDILERWLLDNFNRSFRTLIYKYGIGITGWNEELQQPNVVICSGWLPEDLLKQEIKFNISEIPEYYTAAVYTFYLND